MAGFEEAYPIALDVHPLDTALILGLVNGKKKM